MQCIREGRARCDHRLPPSTANAEKRLASRGT